MEWNHKSTAQKKKMKRYSVREKRCWNLEQGGEHLYIYRLYLARQQPSSAGWHIFSMGRPTVLWQTPMVQTHRPDRCIPRSITISGFDPIYRVGSMKTEERGRPKPDEQPYPHRSINRWIDESELPRRGYRKATSRWTKRGRTPCVPASTTLNEEIDVRRWQQHGRMELRRLVPAAESLKPMMSRLY